MVSPLAPVRRLLWNDAERRPRALWRLVAATVLLGVFVVGASLVVQPARAVVRATVGATVRPLATVGLLVGVTYLPMTVAVVVAGRFLDRRRLSDFGFELRREWWVDLGFGLVLGAALQASVFGVELALGWVTVTGTFVADGSFAVQFLAVLLLMVVVGVVEELLSRGYLLTNAVEGLRRLGTTPAVAVAVLLSSGVFGLAHANNPNATLVSTVGITLAGVVLALGYVLTGDLAIPIGFHVTWNFVQGAVFGFPVSGLPFGVSVVGTSQRGPELWTGGAFGPEAGLVGIGAVLLGAVLTVGYVRWRYRFLAVHPAVRTPDLRWRDP